VLDYFALLGEPRRAWIDPEQLKQKFLELSQSTHPDRAQTPQERAGAQERYTGLNSAYQTLREPKERLAHLIELETGSKPTTIQTAPRDLMDLFLQIGTTLREADKFLEEKRRSTSPLLQVGLFNRAQEFTERIQEMQQEVQRRISSAEDTLKKAQQPHVEELEATYRTFSYLSRWSAQLQERIVQLAI